MLVKACSHSTIAIAIYLLKLMDLSVTITIVPCERVLTFTLPQHCMGQLNPFLNCKHVFSDNL